MLLIPRKTKYKKVRKGKIKTYDSSFKSSSTYGYIGLLSCESVYIHAAQLEGARQTINRHLMRKGRVWTCVFPDLGVTKRPTQVRIGKGTGDVKYWSFRCRPGRILFEVDGVDKEEAILALKSGACKLPGRTKIITF